MMAHIDLGGFLHVLIGEVHNFELLSRLLRPLHGNLKCQMSDAKQIKYLPQKTPAYIFQGPPLHKVLSHLGVELMYPRVVYFGPESVSHLRGHR